MNSSEEEGDSRPLALAGVTADRSRRREIETSEWSLSSIPRDSGERSAPREGFIKHYEIIRKLGEGGMGIVLLARDTKLGRLVAIKLLHDQGQETARLLTEAQATARCRHESIVTIYEVDEIDGHPYMVLEYLDGRTLRDVLAAGAKGQGRALPKGLALDIMMSVARALTVAHELDIVHRDLKPENIMLLASGQVKVLDFGIAGRSDQGAVGGTRPYMAPEQWLGEDIDARTDLWAVGILLYELLDGAHPLAPLTRERLQIVPDMGTPMPRLRDARPELAALSDIVERCLRKPKAERFASAAELCGALEPLREGARPLTLAAGELPFAGLSAFQESDANRFFGRERDIAAVVGRLRRQPLVAVAASSGAGKSSFVRAGVIPALKGSGEDWQVLVLRPGRAPLAALAEALAQAIPAALPADLGDFRAAPGLLGARLRAHCRALGAGSRALVFVDQFEELYTLVADPDERAAFIGSLLGAADEASSPLRVILTIRSDFLDRVVEDRQFMADVIAGLFLLPPVGIEGLREALVRPVEAAGYRFEEEAMITDILDELSQAKTALPLLQFAGSELWEERDRQSKFVTRRSYERLGGVAGALSTHADAVFAALSPADQRLCQAVFLRMVTPERTRALVSMPELSSFAEDPAAAKALVQHLCGARLLLLEIGSTAGPATVELVHESLIQRWPRLARWLDESTADAQFLARLRAAAAQWQAGGEAVGLLWSDRAAAEAREWYERRRMTELDQPLGRFEERYLLSVIAHFERTRRRRRRTIAGAFVLLCAVSVLVSFLAMRAKTNAERADAESARVREQNRELAFQALQGRNAMRMLGARKRQDDPTLVLALLREVEPAAIPKDWAELTSGALTSGVARDELAGLHGDELIYGAAWSPGGTRIVTASEDNTAKILSTSDYRTITSLRGHTGLLWRATWSPDGKHILTASADKTARIWNADGSGAPRVLQDEFPLSAATMSPNGEHVVTATEFGMVRIVSAKDGKRLVLLPHDTDVTAARYSPDGKRIVTTALDGIARVWNATGQGAPLLLRGHNGLISGAAWSPDGTRIATAGVDATVRIWDAVAGSALFVLRGHDDKVINVAWSPDGKLIASASRDKTARIWNADGTGRPIVLRGHKHWIYTVDFGPDSRHLLTVSLDKTLRVWDLDSVVTQTVLEGHTNVINDLRFSPDGRRIVTASQDGTARIWSADGTGIPVVLRGHTGPVQRAMFSPDSRRVVTVAWDKTARIWSVDGTTAPVVLGGHQAQIWDVDWSATGDRIVTAATNGEMRVWRSDGWMLQNATRIEAAKVDVGVHFDRGGHRIVATNGYKDIYDWNLDAAGGPVVLGMHDAGTNLAHFSPDDFRVVSTSLDKTARIWDVRGAKAPVVLRGHEAGLIFAAWSLDGQRVVTTARDMTARVWNADGSGQPVILRGHGDRINWASYSPDGTRIATASGDTTVRVWNADGFGEPFVFAATPLSVQRVVWSPDGKYLAQNSEEKVARLWPAVQPFSGPDDARLWRATSYCIPAPLRVDLLRVSEAEARKDQEACVRRVKAARATEAGSGRRAGS